MLGATNRPEILDPALLRPGRFDRRVAVQPPDRAGRRQDPRGPHPLDPARRRRRPRRASPPSTPGMVGADLANLANEAALLAARRDHDKVQMADFTDSLEKILLGAPRGIVLSPEDRERTAYHESGHALVGMLTPDADPVRKVSIIPRGHGARGDAVDARLRPRLLLARGSRGEDQGRARRPRRRGGRVRQDHHRRRVRHPAADPDRASDGRPLGDERQDRAGYGAPQRGRRAVPAGRQRDLAADAVADRPGGAARSSTTPTRPSPSC